ncbi:ketol-acid reductoisomerase, partial [Vibrio sp. 10N.222.55.E8]
EKFMPSVNTDVIGRGLGETSNQVDNATLIAVNEAIRNHPVEYIGEELRGYMTDMKNIAVGG